MVQAKLTKREREILEHYLKTGKLRVQDIMLFYKNRESIVQAINRFALLGIAKRGEGDLLEVNREKVEAVLTVRV
jgi:hypothetical protein